MDFRLVALIVLIVSIVVLKARFDARWHARPGYKYQRVFSVAAAGLLFLVAGLIGWDLSHSHGWFQGTKWVGGPVWWEVGMGVGLLVLAVVWARRVPLPNARIRG